MRKLWWLGCALSLVACGRIAQGDNDVVGSSDAQLDCTYGKIASVPGLPLSLASTGKTIFVVSYDVGGEIGDLRAISSDGTVHLLVNDNAALTMIPVGSSMVFSRRSFDQQQNLLGETIEIVADDFAISQLDTTNDNIAQLDSLIGDGQGNAYWQRWAKGDPASDIPTGLGSVSLEKYTGGSTITVAGNSGTSWASDIVTDGTDFYGLIPSSSDPYNPDVGRMAIGATPALVLATEGDNYDYFQGVVGVDDTNVVYLTYGSQQSRDVWAVPKNGGTPLQLATNETTTISAVLYDHHVYFVNQNADGTSTVSRVATSGGASVEKIATESTSIGAIAVDACGVIYAVTDSASPGLTGTTIYRSKI